MIINDARRLVAAIALTLLGASVAHAQTVDVTTSNAAPVAGGAAFSYTIVATAGADSLIVTDPLPPGALFQNVAVVGTPLACSGPAPGTPGTVICTNPAYAGGVSTITIVAQYGAGLASGVRTNTAYLVAGAASHTDSVQQNLVNNANLVMTKTASGAVEAGDVIVYNLEVINNGSSSAINVIVTDELPAEVSFVSVFGRGAFHGTCAVRPATNAVVCDADRVPSGSHEITLVVQTQPKSEKPKPDYTVANAATIEAGVGTIAQSS
jgi:uncharacterized repeat protein (TIGR01451 family)